MYQYAELVHWMRNPTKTIIPASAIIELTNICNQDCYYCNTTEFREREPVQQSFESYSLLLERLNQWRSHKPDSYGTLHTITFAGGGEPTLFKGYEKIIEQSIDYGFLTSMTTNGSKLNKLLDIDYNKLRKLGWIGVNMDAGTELLYEEIRKTIPKKSLFTRVTENIKMLTDIGVNVDLKILLGKYNNNNSALNDIFQLAKRTNVRQIYFRPVLYNGQAFPINSLIPKLNELANEHQVNIICSGNRFIPKNYSRCHQMFQNPVFSANGNIYSCCENTGNSNFDIGTWTKEDFRNNWLGKQHMSVYNCTNTNLCPPCGPNKHNVAVQNILNNPSNIESLYY